MSESAIHVFNHHAMATVIQVRIAGQERAYAAQAARAAFDVADRLESLLSRFRENSEISAIQRLQPGEQLRLSEPTFACLDLATQMQAATHGAFSVAPGALRNQSAPPRWTLIRAEMGIRCESGQLEFDTGAIGKGFALDRMAEELAEWECASFLLIAGGSSVLAGAPPDNTPGWSSGLGEDSATRRYWLKHGSLSGSGVAVKGRHILDPRTGKPAEQRTRAWVFAPTAAVSDALSTACMVLDEREIDSVLKGKPDWLALVEREGQWIQFGEFRPSLE